MCSPCALFAVGKQSRLHDFGGTSTAAIAAVTQLTQRLCTSCSRTSPMAGPNGH